MELQSRIETIKGEGLKSAAELALYGLSKHVLGEKLIEKYAFGFEGRVDDERLRTNFSGIDLDNPLIVGAGWDKKGRAVRGLFRLGFAAVEVGTVPLLGQPGSLKPRLWTIGKQHDVGRNALGFNSLGSEVVDRYLEEQSPLPCHVGVNVGKNKVIPDEMSPWAHGQVVKTLYKHASYFVFNPSSPNTQNLRNLQRREPLIAHVQEMKEQMEEAGGQKPLYVKLAPDMTEAQFDESIEATVESGANGLIIANTSTSEFIKRLYGLEGQPGGISGNDAIYHVLVLQMILHAYEQVGDKLEIIGVGGINNAKDVLEFMLAGASAVQIVTAMRPSRGRVAGKINRDLVDWLNERKVGSIKELIGAATYRGAKYANVLQR
jgi:dihydroorotate dehydrogenase